VVAPVVVAAVAKLAYKPAMQLAKKLATKYWSKGADKKQIVQEVRDKGVLEKFNALKLKLDPKKPLNKSSNTGDPSHSLAKKNIGNKKPNMDIQEGYMKASGGKVKKTYVMGGGIRKANYK
jgi:hypothetical protein